MKPDTMSLFEREMRQQLAAAADAVAAAKRSGDPILLQAELGHLDGLRDLARRNGIAIDERADGSSVDEIVAEPAAPEPTAA
jgi:hypothetical protein